MLRQRAAARSELVEGAALLAQVRRLAGPSHPGDVARPRLPSAERLGVVAAGSVRAAGLERLRCVAGDVQACNHDAAACHHEERRLASELVESRARAFAASRTMLGVAVVLAALVLP